MFVCSVTYLLFILWNLKSYSCPHVNTLYSPATHRVTADNKENSCDVFFPTDFLSVWTN